MNDDIPLRPIPLFKTNPVEIKELPEWVNTERPKIDLSVSIFDRAYLFYHETIEYSRVAVFLLKLAVLIINLILTIQKLQKKE